MSLLAEMFPTVSTIELVHCLSLAAGSIDAAAQYVLECLDSADENSSSPVPLSASVFSHYHEFINPQHRYSTVKTVKSRKAQKVLGLDYLDFYVIKTSCEN